LWRLSTRIRSCPEITLHRKTGGCWLRLGLSCKCLYENTCLSSIVGTTAVSGSAFSHLEGDINRFQRMGSIDSFNQVLRVYPWALRLYHPSAPLYNLRLRLRLYRSASEWYNLNAQVAADSD
jgi:hypothetical protein